VVSNLPQEPRCYRCISPLTLCRSLCFYWQLLSTHRLYHRLDKSWHHSTHSPFWWQLFTIYSH